MAAILTRRARPAHPEAAPEKTRRPAASTRTRILGWYVVIMLAAIVLGLLIQRYILIAQVDDDVNNELDQQFIELQQLSAGLNPETGEPFADDVEAIFDLFLSRNVPEENEALFTLVDGAPYASTITQVQLFDDPQIVAEWAAIENRTRAEIDTDAGRVRYLAVPVEAGGETRGTFVSVMFLSERRSDVNRVIRDGAIVFGSVFVLASAVAWFAAGRILRPVRLLTNAAHNINDANWSGRIPVRGDDEISELARTFNDMLDRLEDAFSTQRRFVDDAGHELRTPITIIRGHLELLSTDPAERSDTMRLVMDELDRMSRIVDDLLLLAKSEQPDFLDVHPLDVAEFTNDIAAKAVALGNRDWTVAEASETVMIADRQRLTQAIMNLARNAVEHTTDGATITIGSREEGANVHFWVRDTGVGISHEEQQRIFERFARSRERRAKAEGAGLGLAILEAIVIAHDGRIQLESAPGQGSTFTLILPADGPPRRK